MDQLISAGLAIVGAGIAHEVYLGGMDIKEAAVVGGISMAGVFLGGGLFGEWFSDNPYYSDQNRGISGEWNAGFTSLGEAAVVAAVGGLAGAIGGMLILKTPSKNIMYNTLGAGGGLFVSLFINVQSKDKGQ